jgi:hypothetical protein
MSAVPACEAGSSAAICCPRPRRLQRDARLEARDDVEPVHVARRGEVLRRPERRPQLGRAGAREAVARRQHADDRVALAAQGDLRADHLRVAAEAPLPEAVAEDDRRRGFGLILAG